MLLCDRINHFIYLKNNLMYKKNLMDFYLKNLDTI